MDGQLRSSIEHRLPTNLPTTDYLDLSNRYLCHILSGYCLDSGGHFSLPVGSFCFPLFFQCHGGLLFGFPVALAFFRHGILSWQLPGIGQITRRPGSSVGKVGALMPALDVVSAA